MLLCSYVKGLPLFNKRYTKEAPFVVCEYGKQKGKGKLDLGVESPCIKLSRVPSRPNIF